MFESSIQPDNWHDVFTFVRDMRNQLQRTYPFSDDNDNNNSKEHDQKLTNDDEGVIISNHEMNQFSSASSTVSSDEFDATSSTSSVLSSYEAIKNELNYHYYGLCRSLESLTAIANRVTEKYRENSIF